MIPRICPICGEGDLSLKLGRYGAFVGCSNYPECRYTRKLGEEEKDAEARQASGAGMLGVDPERRAEEVWLKVGRFGPFLQVR